MYALVALIVLMKMRIPSLWLCSSRCTITSMNSYRKLNISFTSHTLKLLGEEELFENIKPSNGFYPEFYFSGSSKKLLELFMYSFLTATLLRFLVR